MITFRISGSNKYQQVVLLLKILWESWYPMEWVGEYEIGYQKKDSKLQITDGSGKVNFNMDGNLNAGKCGTANYSDVVWQNWNLVEQFKVHDKIWVLTMQNRVWLIYQKLLELEILIWNSCNWQNQTSDVERFQTEVWGVTGVLLGLENVKTYTGTILIYSLVVSISKNMSV